MTWQTFIFREILKTQATFGAVKNRCYQNVNFFDEYHSDLVFLLRDNFFESFNDTKIFNLIISVPNDSAVVAFTF